ncbi:MAG: hypothetical protein K2L01_03130, partial [Rikenellaceae bacterium]|nr:hypothetical protein [Rikenellaceae bacterium]
GEFFDYKNVKALRAYSGGSCFSFTVKASEGVASLKTVDDSWSPSTTTDWVTVNDNIITVSKNDTDDARECRIAVSVGNTNIGLFYIVQGKPITFNCTGSDITDGYLRQTGGTGSSSAVTKVTFDISQEELDGLEIVPENNGVTGITVEIDRVGRTISTHFMASIDASEMSAEGIEVPVRFVDVNGMEQARITFLQKPAKITFNPIRYKNISYKGATIMASVTTEGDAKWNVKSISDKNGDTGTASSWVTKLSPSSSENSGKNLVLEIKPNSTSNSRTAYVRVQSRYTISKPYEITQVPSYGIKEISADRGWDNESNTLKTFSKGNTYTFTFETEIAVPEHITLSVDCDPDPNYPEPSGITASEITKVSGNTYTFTLTVPDSDNSEEEVCGNIAITADGGDIGGFTVMRAYKPTFVSMETSVYGGVKDRPELKTATFRASEWDIKEFTSSNGRLPVTQISEEEIEVSYAETMTYSDATEETTVTMSLNGGNSVSYATKQSPVIFVIDDTDLAKLMNISKNATDVEITVTTKANAGGVPWHVASTSAEWLSTIPAAGGPETNASGSILTVRFAANSLGDRTGSFVLESRNTTSPIYNVSQNLSLIKI